MHNLKNTSLSVPTSTPDNREMIETRGPGEGGLATDDEIAPHGARVAQCAESGDAGDTSPDSDGEESDEESSPCEQ